MRSMKKIQSLLSLADVRINGDMPWDIHVHDNRLYERVLTGGSLALGESYMDGWWDCKSLDQLFDRIVRAKLEQKAIAIKDLVLDVIKAKITNPQRLRAFNVGKRHYDIGNEFYKHMLDKKMNYSCGYWKDAETLDEAQEAKLNLICRKIMLKPGMKVLDIGCGWGGFAKYAAEKYKAEVVGITVSKEQVKLARELCKGLPVEIRFQDYRELNEKFNHIVSVGMFEHIGPKNHRTFMRVVDKNLKENGLFLLHTIGTRESETVGEPWMDKYIFPEGVLPSLKKIKKAAKRLFVIEDWHSFGPDYDKTLMAWHRNFTENWNKIKHNYDERFFRMWRYFLLSSAGTFRSRRNYLWQIVFSKNGVDGGYQSIR